MTESENKTCYLCSQECRGQVGADFYAIGKDKSGKELYRHVKNCQKKK